MKTKIKILIVLIVSAGFISLIKPANKDQATVRRFQGVPVFIMCEPVTPYEVTGKVTNDDALSWAVAITGDETGRGLKDNIDVLVNNANRKAKKGKFYFDAIITDDGSTGACIKFTEHGQN